MAVLFPIGNFVNIKVYCADYCFLNALFGEVLLIKNIVKKDFSKVMREIHAIHNSRGYS